MKRVFICLALGCCPVLAGLNGVSAQTQHRGSKFSVPPSKDFVYRDNDASKNASASAAGIAVNKKAIKDFGKTFKTNSQVSWYDLKNGFAAKFTENEIQNTVHYDRHGRWIATMRVYREKDLPKDIRHLVKSTYYDFSIFVVIEVNSPDGTAYLVKMEDANSWLTIRVVNGEMDIYERYDKA